MAIRIASHTMSCNFYSSCTCTLHAVAIFQFTQQTYQNSEGNNLLAAIELISGMLTFPINVQVLTNDFTGQLNAAIGMQSYGGILS